jgi:hypothetical protein
MDNIRDILQPYYPGTKYEMLFQGNFVDVVEGFNGKEWNPLTVWNPLKLKEYNDAFRIYCTLGWILKLVEELLAKHNTITVAYYLTLFLDMHIPLVIYIEDNKKGDNDHLLTRFEEKAPVEEYMPTIERVFHEGNLPDVLNYIVQCSFFSDNRSKTNPIVHLISKALPHRCTIRNLREIISNYCRKHEDVYNFVLGCLKCSLLGLYESCKERPDLATRIVLIRKFNNISRGSMLQWMMKDHQQLLFYVIKEFLIYGVRQIPSLYNEIKERYYWDKFEECVERAMNIVRKSLRPEHNIMNFVGVEEQLGIMNKQQVHHLFRPTKHSFAKIVLMECDRIDDTKSVEYLVSEFDMSYKKLMMDMAIRIPQSKSIPFKWLEYFKISPNIVKELQQIQEMFIFDGSKGSLKSLLTHLDRYSFECIRTFVDVFNTKMNVRVFTLPAHIYIEQCKALRRKFQIPNGVPLPEYCGSTLLCLECNQFKGFTNKRDNEKNKISNLYAFGNSKVLVDDETMKFYCGKRCDKVDGKKRHHYVPEYSSYISSEISDAIRVAEERNKKRCAKEKRKELKNEICSQTELCRINLNGQLLQFYGNMYTVCPKCANFMVVDCKYYTKDGFYCGCCIQNGKLYTNISCEYCQAVRGNETWNPVQCLEKGKQTSIYLCQSCHKPWIRSAAALLEKDTIMRGLLNKWKRLQHPSTI